MRTESVHRRLCSHAASVQWRWRKINQGQVCQMETKHMEQARCPQGSPGKVREHPTCAGCWRCKSAKVWARRKEVPESYRNKEMRLCMAGHWDGGHASSERELGASSCLNSDFILKALEIPEEFLADVLNTICLERRLCGDRMDWRDHQGSILLVRCYSVVDGEDQVTEEGGASGGFAPSDVYW